MISKAQEAKAQRLVRESIDSALAEMREYVNRELLAGRTPDKRMIVAMSNGMNKLAEEYSVDLMAGEYGSMIQSAMKTAAAEVADIAGGISLSVGTRQIDAALTVAGMKVKGILEEGQAIVGEEMIKSIVGGKSQRDVAKSIAERLQVRDKDGELGDIPAWRAELVARNEVSSNYRLEKQTASKDAGFTRFRMTGPDDERTAGDVCSRYLGQEHTVEEWEEIGKKEGIDPNYPLLEWGFHVNCRHDFDPVPESIEA